MNRPMRRFVVLCLLIFCAVPRFSAGSAPDLLLQTMQQELKRANTLLAKSEPAPYYLSYAVTDIDGSAIVAANGSLMISTSVRRRLADVMMRVGSPALDNTHNKSRGSGITSGALPLNDDSDAIARVLWQLTNRGYDQASSAFLTVKTNTAVQSEEEDKSPDFSKESAQEHMGDARAIAPLNQKQWEDRARKISAEFLKYPEVYDSTVYLQVSDDHSYLVTSEGTAVVRPSALRRLVIQGETPADDGMELMRVETFQAPSADELPSAAELLAKADKISEDLKALRAAPTAEPYAGPALLSGRGARGFFPEGLGT